MILLVMVVVLVMMMVATASSLAVMVMMSAATFAVFVVLVSVVATTVAAFARHHVDKTLHFFGCSFACCDYLSHIVQVVPGEWVIEIQFNSVVSNFQYEAFKAQPVFVDQGKNGTGINL